jgi:hypothetical protein
MMHVSHESDAQVEARLLTVIALADFVSYDDTFAFVESPAGEVITEIWPGVVALVRDDDVWSQLVPIGSDNAATAEPYALFRFHFPPGIDNSGFVGWLATRLKRELGSGVFVVCGQNSRRGGIYDYWGCPLALRDDARRLIDCLRGRAGSQGNLIPMEPSEES